MARRGTARTVAPAAPWSTISRDVGSGQCTTRSPCLIFPVQLSLQQAAGDGRRRVLDGLDRVIHVDVAALALVPGDADAAQRGPLAVENGCCHPDDSRVELTHRHVIAALLDVTQVRAELLPRAPQSGRLDLTSVTRGERLQQG